MTKKKFKIAVFCSILIMLCSSAVCREALCFASADNLSEVNLFTNNNWKTEVVAGTTVTDPSGTWSSRTAFPMTSNGSDTQDSMWFEKSENVLIPNLPDKKFILRFTGLQRDAIVYVKSASSSVFVKVGEVKGPDGSIDISEAVKPGETAAIRIWVTRWWRGIAGYNSNSDAFLNNLSIDYLRKRQLIYKLETSLTETNTAPYRQVMPIGITEGVSLIMKTASASVDNVFVQTTYRSNPKKLTLRIDAEKRISEANLRVKAYVTELNGSTASLPSKIDEFTGGRQEVDIPWENPVLWEVGDENAKLYYACVDIIDESDNVVYSHPKTRFGFREIWRDGNDMYLNGHILRLRLAPFATGGVPSMVFYGGMGFNTLLVQPHINYWWSVERGQNLFPASGNSGTEVYLSKTMLDYADEKGWAIYMSAPTVDHINSAFVYDGTNSAAYQNEYAMYFDMWHKKNNHQNRPSIFSWTTSMNSGGSTLEPGKIGMNSSVTTGAAQWLLDKARVKEAADKIIKKADPTRFLYSHHGGMSDLSNGLTDIETVDLYTNFIPIQEVEEYISNWAENGERPWGAAEFGVGFPADFFNNGKFLPQFTEFLASFYGDEAYEAQLIDYIKECEDVVNTTSLSSDYAKSRLLGMDIFKPRRIFEKLHNWTLFGRYNDDYTTRVLRSWRTYGLNYGAFPFNMEVGFGVSDTYSQSAYVSRKYLYRELENFDPATLVDKPSWANLYYDQFKGVSQALLVYIGGQNENFTEKGHNFKSRETVEKSVIAVWDGPYGKNIDVEWEVKADALGVINSGVIPLNLSAGDISKTFISFAVPDVANKTRGEIVIKTRDKVSSAVISSDTFEMTFFPVEEDTPQVTKNWRIYDTVGKTKAEFLKIGIDIADISENDSLDGIDVLVIGAECVNEKSDVIYSKADIERGLKVLVMEQGVDGLEALGFRTEDCLPRDVFPRDNIVLSGISAEDLRDWRGEGTLLPETSAGMRPRVVTRAPHWKNTGSVASVIIETPQMGAFTPLAETGFDLQYSALLSWKHGEGEVLFSQFDVNGRIGLEPAAEQVVRKLIDYLDASADSGIQSKRLVYLGFSKDDKKYLANLGFELSLFSDYSSLNTEIDILIIGDIPEDVTGIERFANAGGDVVVLPQFDNVINKSALYEGVNTESRTDVFSVKPSGINSDEPLLRGIGPQLLNFRVLMDVTCFENGLLDGFLFVKERGNGGRIIFSQMDWRKLTKDAKTIAQVHNVHGPGLNTYKFYRQIFANLGACTASNTADWLFN